jgi:hypothetical protein
MTPNEAQILSEISFGLFGIVLIVLATGLPLKLSHRAIHWITLTGFSACLLMGVITSILYFWHHWLRH